MLTASRSFSLATIIAATLPAAKASVLPWLLILFSFSQVTALKADSSDDEESITEGSIAFETYPIHRENLVWFGKRKSRIGDYADVTHVVGKVTTRYFERDLKFSLRVATLEGATLKLNVKNHTVFTPPDDIGLMQDVVDFAIEEKWGISNVEAPLTYKSTYAATLATGDSPGDTWQFKVELLWRPENMSPAASGTLSNGTRTLYISSSSVAPTFASIAEIHEDGELLCRKSNGREYDYAFRTGLSPDLKLLLLAAMEILEVNVHGEFW